MEDKKDDPRKVAAICPECGEIIEVKDPTLLILTLHQMNACAIRTLVGGRETD